MLGVAVAVQSRLVAQVGMAVEELVLQIMEQQRLGQLTVAVAVVAVEIILELLVAQVWLLSDTQTPTH
jgi:hypothetical protein